MNKVILIGRVATNPFVVINKNGFKVAKFKLAVSRNFSYKNKETDFIPCVAFKQRAEFLERYLEKGDLVSIDGKFSSSSYLNKQNQLVNDYVVLVDSIDGLEPKAIRDMRKSNNGVNNQEQNPYIIPNDLTFEEGQEKELEPIPWDLPELPKEDLEKPTYEQELLTVPKENVEEEVENED